MKFFLIIISTLLLSTSAHAVLIERDWLLPGDTALTYDTDTGLEWLDLNETSDLSYNQVAPQLLPGNLFQGFAYASTLQIIDFLAAADLVEFNNAKTMEGPKIEYLLSFWGVLWSFNPGERSEFLTGNTDGLLAGEHWSGRVFWLPTLDTGVSAKGDVWDDDSSNFTIASALVRQANTVVIDGDVNRDGITNTADLLIVRRVVFGYPVATGVEPGHADFYPEQAPDGIINFSDMILLYQLILNGQ